MFELVSIVSVGSMGAMMLPVDQVSFAVDAVMAANVMAATPTVGAVAATVTDVAYPGLTAVWPILATLAILGFVFRRVIGVFGRRMA